MHTICMMLIAMLGSSIMVSGTIIAATIALGVIGMAAFGTRRTINAENLTDADADRYYAGFDANNKALVDEAVQSGNQNWLDAHPNDHQRAEEEGTLAGKRVIARIQNEINERQPRQQPPHQPQPAGPRRRGDDRRDERTERPTWVQPLLIGVVVIIGGFLLIYFALLIFKSDDAPEQAQGQGGITVKTQKLMLVTFEANIGNPAVSVTGVTVTDAPQAGGAPNNNAGGQPNQNNNSQPGNTPPPTQSTNEPDWEARLKGGN